MDYSKYSTNSRPDWGRIVSWFLVCIALTVTMMSCQAAHADELPIPVQTIIGECANCSDDGMVAVANVIRNRMELRGQTAEEVCLAREQFSFWNDRGRAKNFIKNASHPVIDRAWSAWQVSATEDITGGADLYHADYVKPRWDWSKTVYMGKFGRHLFYREIR